jgi:hypothetical protein
VNVFVIEMPGGSSLMAARPYHTTVFKYHNILWLLHLGLILQFPVWMLGYVLWDVAEGLVKLKGIFRHMPLRQDCPRISKGV